MVKLTQEIIEQASQFTNPVRDRQLDLRGYKIPVIENLGGTLDQFDTIDFTDNEIRKLDGFPYLKRLKCLLLSNNHISRIAENLEQNLPNLESLILIGNRMEELGDLDSLITIKSLQSISLLFNPVVKKRYYRFYIIYKLPQLKRIDFQKVKLKEREAARKLFTGIKGPQLLEELGKKSKLVVSSNVPTGLENGPGNKLLGMPKAPNNIDAGLTTAAKQDLESIKVAIAAATTLEDIERLNRMLQSGFITNPVTTNGVIKATEKFDKEDVEEDEADEMET